MVVLPIFLYSKLHKILFKQLNTTSFFRKKDKSPCVQVTQRRFPIFLQKCPTSWDGLSILVLSIEN